MTFQMGQVCFDSESKDIVKITNGTDTGGVFIPTTSRSPFRMASR